MKKKVQRNDPCPCGSGSKYKKCCLRKQQETERLAHAAASAQERRNEVFAVAIDWLNRHHLEAIEAATEEYFSAISNDGRELSEADAEYLLTQSAEWVLAEGTADVGGRSLRLRDLVLEKGPILDADQRLWFERSTEEPMRLWRVTRTDPGVGLELRSFFDEPADTFYVNERSASQSLDRLAVIGARVARWKGSWELANVYSIPGSEVLNLVNFLEEHCGGDPADPALAATVSQLTRDYWVRLFTRPQSLPKVFDGLGDRIELTTDHWQILDRGELERRLAAEPDVDGSSERGWSRLEEPEAEMSRTLLALNPGKRQDRLEVFARTRKLAEEGRSWLEGVAGPTLRFITREIVDPVSEHFLGDDDGDPSVSRRSFAVDSFTLPPLGSESDPESELSNDDKSRMMEAIYRKQYAGIADQVIPALGNKSPRQALKEDGGQRRVRLWLEGFESNEERLATADQRPRVDLGFLWREVGLEPSTR